jgi:hypothetical protein
MSFAQEDAVRLAVLENELSHIKNALTRSEEANARQEAKIDAVLSTMSEARGSWRTLLLMGGAAGSIGGGIAWLIQHLPRA